MLSAELSEANRIGLVADESVEALAVKYRLFVDVDPVDRCLRQIFLPSEKRFAARSLSFSTYPDLEQFEGFIPTRFKE
jgi:hypothetical protein